MVDWLVWLNIIRIMELRCGRQLAYLATSSGNALALALGINHQNMRSSIVTTCPQERKKSNALIAIARSIAHSMSAYHVCIPSTNRIPHSPRLLGATVLLVEQVREQVRSSRMPRYLFRKSGSGDSDVWDSDDVRYLWIVASVDRMGQSKRRAMAD